MALIWLIYSFIIAHSSTEMDYNEDWGDENEIFAGFAESEEEEPGSPAPGPIPAPAPPAAPAPAPRRPAGRLYAEVVRGRWARGRGRRRCRDHDRPRGDQGRGTRGWGGRGTLGWGDRGLWQRRPRPSMSRESVS